MPEPSLLLGPALAVWEVGDSEGPCLAGRGLGLGGQVRIFQLEGKGVTTLREEQDVKGLGHCVPDA